MQRTLILSSLVFAAMSCKPRDSSGLAEFQFESAGRLNILALDPSDNKVKVRGCEVAKVEAAITRQLEAGKPIDMVQLAFSDCTVSAENFADLPLDIYKGFLAQVLGARDLSGLDKDIQVAMFDLNRVLAESGIEVPKPLQGNVVDAANPPKFSEPEDSKKLGDRPTIGAAAIDSILSQEMVARGDTSARREVQMSALISMLRRAKVREDLKKILTSGLAKLEAAHNLQVKLWEANTRYNYIIAMLSLDPETRKSAIITQRQGVYQFAMQPFLEIAKVGGLDAYTKVVATNWGEMGQKSLPFLDALDTCDRAGMRFPSIQEFNGLMVAARIGQGPGAQADFNTGAAWIKDGAEFNADKTLFSGQVYEFKKAAALVYAMNLDQVRGVEPKHRVFCVARQKQEWTRASVVQPMETRLAEIKREQDAQVAREAAEQRKRELASACQDMKDNQRDLATAQKSVSEYNQQWSIHVANWNKWNSKATYYVNAINAHDGDCTYNDEWVSCRTALRWARSERDQWDPDHYESMYKYAQSSVNSINKDFQAKADEFRKQYGNWYQNLCR